jgi:TrmH family RNA methyltransferase
METVPLSERVRKHILALRKREERERHAEFIAEGVRVCRELLRSSLYRALFVVLRAEAGAEARQLAQEFARQGVVVYTATERHFRALSQTETPQDILAVVSYPVEEPAWEERMLVLDGIADPGNMGTILRTAAWFGWRAVVVLPGGVDVYNPKVVRASAGALFHVHLHRLGQVEELEEVLRRGYVLFGAEPTAGVPIERVQLPRRALLAIGNEAHGLSEAVRRRCRLLFRIPGAEVVESLNVAIATAIVLYHFWRHHGAISVADARTGRRSR